MMDEKPAVELATPAPAESDGDDSDEIEKEIQRLESAGTEEGYYDEEDTEDNIRGNHALRTEDTIDVSIDQEIGADPAQKTPDFRTKLDVLKQTQNAWERDSTPLRLGNLYCFWYDKKGQPRIVIGPDYIFSGVELGLANVVTWGVTLIPCILQSNYWLLTAGLVLLGLQNASFLATVLSNPGLPPRDPSQHQKSYLYKVKTTDQHNFCDKCKIIARKDVETEHCTYCNYCMEKLDHHCPWSSKCIASGNILAFRVFICLTVVLFVFVILASIYLGATENFFERPDALLNKSEGN